ncbi:MAG: hypothetical protein CVU31_01470 [Betaproteobacteria bacterium HGW-Betaproteobacteria-4]|jgi:HlyD family secretion protein|nr:MAG: hypothetical protein CVU31_01470 [Betaproteobacteria bacterium HGW-Betaproteobacteria-4]
MVDGTVEHVTADAADNNTGNGNTQTDPAKKNQPLVYKAQIALNRMSLAMDEKRFMLSAGMQTNAEIKLGDRTVMKYLLSLVRKAWHEAGRER